MKTFISKEQADKQLCIHCVHGMPTVIGLIACGKFRSKVDNSPKCSAAVARESENLCGDKFWEIKPDIFVSESPEEETAEYCIETFMNTARQHVRKGTRPLYTCGFLDKAIERAKKEQL